MFQPTCSNRNDSIDRVLSFYNVKISSRLYKWHIDPTECQYQLTLILTVSTTWNTDQSEIGPTKESTRFLQLNQGSANKEARYSTQNKQLNNVTSHQVTRLFTHDASNFYFFYLKLGQGRRNGDRRSAEQDQLGRWPSVLVGGLVDTMSSRWSPLIDILLRPIVDEYNGELINYCTCANMSIIFICSKRVHFDW